MSILAEANRYSGPIRDAIGRIANKGVTGRDGMPIGTKKIMGYVCAIHEEGDLAGTIDVQEFNYEPDEYSKEGVGHHEGVLLSAIQNNSEGFLIVPMLFSDVVIVQNPCDGKEYVLMYSQAKRMQLTAQSLKSENDGEVKIGVTEVEDYVEDSEGGQEKDFNELEPTKNKTETIYTSTSITDKIISPDDEEGLVEEKTVEHKSLTVGDTKITIDGKTISVESSSQFSFKINNTEIIQEDGKVTIKVGGTTIIEEDGKVDIDTQNCTVKGSNIEVNGSQVKITGGNLTVKGQSSVEMNGPFNAIKACPFSGAPHCGSIVTGT